MEKKVLVVDDDPVIRSLVIAILGPEGYQCTDFPSAVDAFKYLDTAQRPLDLQLILLDVMMPGMNGLDALVRLKMHSHTQKIPVVMLTGEAKADDIMKGYDVGADYYITKPFTRQQLLYGLNMVFEDK